MPQPKPTSVDDYIAGFPQETQKKLAKIRAATLKAAPKAVELISYGIPAYKLAGRVVIYFAGYKNHVSIYPAPRSHPEFKSELLEYKGGKSTVQFPLDEPISTDLVTRIVKFRVKTVTEPRRP